MVCRTNEAPRSRSGQNNIVRLAGSRRQGEPFVIPHRNKHFESKRRAVASNHQDLMKKISALFIPFIAIVAVAAGQESTPAPSNNGVPPKIPLRDFFKNPES